MQFLGRIFLGSIGAGITWCSRFFRIFSVFTVFIFYFVHIILQAVCNSWGTLLALALVTVLKTTKRPVKTTGLPVCFGWWFLVTASENRAFGSLIVRLKLCSAYFNHRVSLYILVAIFT